MQAKRAIELEKMYERDEESRSFIIPIGIDRYRDVFNEWDPAPFKRRDIEPELRDFLEDCSSDVPLRSPIIIQFSVPAAADDSEKEKRVTEGLQNSFRFHLKYLRKKIKRTYEMSAWYTLTAFLFLCLAYMLGKILPEGVLYAAFTEGAFIGGWVFLWEAISSLSFKNRDVRYEYRLYQRLFAAPIRFIYRE